MCWKGIDSGKTWLDNSSISGETSVTRQSGETAAAVSLVQPRPGVSGRGVTEHCTAPYCIVVNFGAVHYSAVA